MQLTGREHLHGYITVKTARTAKIFGDEMKVWQINQTSVKVASGGDRLKLKQWQDAMKQDILRLGGQK
jgi:hypothetical protein